MQHVVEVFAIIERLFREQYGGVKLYLWKNCGHPSVPRSKEAFDQLQEILKFCHGLWPGNAESRILVIVVVNSFRLLATPEIYPEP